MEDRRQMRRFTLQLPCLIYDWNDVRDELLFEARTVNISAGGALVETDGGCRWACRFISASLSAAIGRMKK